MSGERDTDAALDLLGLALRAGRLAVGTHAVKDAARRDELLAVVIARDATENARDRVMPLLSAKGVSVVECDSAARLGRAVGRHRVVVAGLTDAGFARGVLAVLPPAAGRNRTENE